jgi:hypothetical protein
MLNFLWLLLPQYGGDINEGEICTSKYLTILTNPVGVFHGDPYQPMLENMSSTCGMMFTFYPNVDLGLPWILTGSSTAAISSRQLGTTSNGRNLNSIWKFKVNALVIVIHCHLKYVHAGTWKKPSAWWKCIIIFLICLGKISGLLCPHEGRNEICRGHRLPCQ